MASSKLSSQSPAKHWAIAAGLALTGALNPLPFPLTGLHKFYLGQPLWGGLYLLLGWTQIPRIACAIEGVWYLTRYRDIAALETTSTAAGAAGQQVSEQAQAIATAVRELEKLRQEGLLSEQEFEQKRRALLAKLA